MNTEPISPLSDAYVECENILSNDYVKNSHANEKKTTSVETKNAQEKIVNAVTQLVISKTGELGDLLLQHREIGNWCDEVDKQINEIDNEDLEPKKPDNPPALTYFASPFYVYVSGLNFAAKLHDIFYFFGGEKNVVNIHLYKNTNPNLPANVCTNCLLELKSLEALVEALKLDYTELMGRPLHVEHVDSNTKEKRRYTPAQLENARVRSPTENKLMNRRDNNNKKQNNKIVNDFASLSRSAGNNRDVYRKPQRVAQNYSSNSYGGGAQPLKHSSGGRMQSNDVRNCQLSYSKQNSQRLDQYYHKPQMSQTQLSGSSYRKRVSHDSQQFGLIPTTPVEQSKPKLDRDQIFGKGKPVDTNKKYMEVYERLDKEKEIKTEPLPQENQQQNQQPRTVKGNSLTLHVETNQKRHQNTKQQSYNYEQISLNEVKEYQKENQEEFSLSYNQQHQQPQQQKAQQQEHLKQFQKSDKYNYSSNHNRSNYNNVRLQYKNQNASLRQGDYNTGNDIRKLSESTESSTRDFRNLKYYEGVNNQNRRKNDYNTRGAIKNENYSDGFESAHSNSQDYYMQKFVYENEQNNRLYFNNANQKNYESNNVVVNNTRDQNNVSSNLQNGNESTSNNKQRRKNNKNTHSGGNNSREYYSTNKDREKNRQGSLEQHYLQNSSKYLSHKPRLVAQGIKDIQKHISGDKANASIKNQHEYLDEAQTPVSAKKSISYESRGYSGNHKKNSLKLKQSLYHYNDNSASNIQLSLNNTRKVYHKNSLISNSLNMHESSSLMTVRRSKTVNEEQLEPLRHVCSESSFNTKEEKKLNANSKKTFGDYGGNSKNTNFDCEIKPLKKEETKTSLTAVQLQPKQASTKIKRKAKRQENASVTTSNKYNVLLDVES